MTGSAPATDFWSRRRAAVRAETEAETAAVVAAEAEALERQREEAAAERSDDDILAELGLPDPDTLGQGDDFRGFLEKTVPERIRRRALRRLWRSNPVLANLDGLVDHGEDFTDRATVVADMQTAYQVGRGMLSHVLALADAAVAAETEAEGAAETEVAAAPVPVSAAEEEDAGGDAAAQPVTQDATPVARRHMRFAFAAAEDKETHA